MIPRSFCDITQRYHLVSGNKWRAALIKWLYQGAESPLWIAFDMGLLLSNITHHIRMWVYFAEKENFIPNPAQKVSLGFTSVLHNGICTIYTPDYERWNAYVAL